MWMVIEESKPDSIEQQEQSHLSKDLIFANLFVQLKFGEDLHINIEKLNEEVRLYNNNERTSMRYKSFLEQKFLIGLALMIGATGHGAKGSELQKASEYEEELKDDWPSLILQPDFGRFMLQNHFKEFCKFIPAIWVDQSISEQDQWWQFSGAVNDLNS